MKYILALFALLCSLLSFSQNTNNSLLWEITGENLQKPSYLYGTMHVSNKVAFRLDDVFFDAFNNSDYVALESNPKDWLEHNFYTTTLYPQNYTSTFKDDFYSNIVGIETPQDILIRTAIRFNNRLVNGILYRKDASKDNFEEETFLDMFIYQAGKKTNKPIISLENIEESRFLVAKASKNSRKETIDPWLAKLYEKESAYLLRENTYRDRNVQLLDSIGQASNSEYFRENMLYKRNENMVNVLDSIMVQKSVFSGVGAAHLGGEKGMITMLRDRGYTVKPLTSKKTDRAKTEKEKLEKAIKTPVFSKQQTPDGFISLNAYTQLREFLYRGIKYYISPDLPNGAHLTISRINTFNYLPNERGLSLKNIENYLFEDIPGEIISKEDLVGEFPGFSILNKTKKGDFEKYHIYQTPLEFIVIKLSGLKNYVKDYEAEVFNSIVFKPKATKLEAFKSPFGKFKVDFPNTKITDNLEFSGNKLVQGFYDNHFYFIREGVYHDTYYIEEDAFEAKYIIEHFFKNLELKDYRLEDASANYKSYEAVADLKTQDSSKINIKTVIKDGSYYTLGVVGKDDAVAKKFIKSFKLQATNYPDEFNTVIDTSLYFSVKTNTKTLPPRGNSYEKSKKDYLEKEVKTTYYSKANEQIYVSKLKYHDLQMFTHVDSLWSRIDKAYLKYGEDDDDYKNFDIKKRLKKTAEDGTKTYELFLKDSTSSKQIYLKHFLKKGSLFELRSVTDSLQPTSQFITQFYDSFKHLDTLLGKDVFKDKTDVFFKALRNNDSIVFKAPDHIKFNDSHAEKLMTFVGDFEFPKNKKDLKLFLVEALSELSHPKLNAYLEQLYVDSYASPDIQIAILNRFFDENKSSGYKTFLKLLNKDLPLDKREIRRFLNNYNDSLVTKKELFPDLLDFTSINEYKGSVYELLSRLRIKNQIKPKAYKSYRNQIINDGKIEIKRSLSENTSSFKGSFDLIDYVYLIFPYRKDANAKSFFKKLIDSKNGHAQASYYALLAQAKEPIPLELTKKTVQDDNVKYLVLRKLYHKDLYEHVNRLNITQQDYIKSYLFANAKIEVERDSIVFVGKKKFTTDLDKEGDMYFYKLIKTTDNSTKTRLYYFGLLKPEDDNIVIDPYHNSGTYGEAFKENKPELEIYQAVLDDAIHKTRKRLKD